MSRRIPGTSCFKDHTRALLANQKACIIESFHKARKEPIIRNNAKLSAVNATKNNYKNKAVCNPPPFSPPTPCDDCAKLRRSDKADTCLPDTSWVIRLCASAQSWPRHVAGVSVRPRCFWPFFRLKVPWPGFCEHSVPRLS